MHAGKRSTMSESGARSRALNEQGLAPFHPAVDTGLPESTFRPFRIGHEPKLGRLVELCNALGLELYIGRSRDAEGDLAHPPLEERRTSIVQLAGSTPIGIVNC